MKACKDITGNRYSHLTAIEKVGEKIDKKGFRLSIWKFRCDCGNYVEMSITEATSGHRTSCGCDKYSKRTKHRMCGSRIYRCWNGIKQRCLNPNGTGYMNYGGKGITICDEWKNDFLTFYQWAMANGYNDDLTIDRIDATGNYEPSNCRWADKSTQSANRKPSGKCEYIGVFQGETKYFTHITSKGKIVFSYYSRSKNDCARKRNEFIKENNLTHPLNEIKEEYEDVKKCKRNFKKGRRLN